MGWLGKFLSAVAVVIAVGAATLFVSHGTAAAFQVKPSIRPRLDSSLAFPSHHRFTICAAGTDKEGADNPQSGFELESEESNVAAEVLEQGVAGLSVTATENQDGEYNDGTIEKLGEGVMGLDVNQELVDEAPNTTGDSASADERPAEGSGSPQGHGQPLTDHEWLETIKEGAKSKVGEKYKDAKWSEFIEDVAIFLKNEDDHDDDDIIDCVAGLINYGIRRVDNLKRVSNNKDTFGKRLDGVLPSISDILFDEYVAPKTQDLPMPASDNPLNFPQEMIRCDYLTSPPPDIASFIGSDTEPFGPNPLVQEEILNRFVKYASNPRSAGGRREFAVFPAMSGFGKTVALHMIFDFVQACYQFENNPPDQANIKTKMEKYVADLNPPDRTIIAECAPVAITLNHLTVYSKDIEKDVNKALSARFAYSYLANKSDAESFKIWRKQFERSGTTLSGTLEILRQLSNNAGRNKLLLLVDETNFDKNAIDIVRQLREGAFKEDSELQPRIVFTGLTDSWIRSTSNLGVHSPTTTSGYPVALLTSNGVPSGYVHKTVRKLLKQEKYPRANAAAAYFIALASGRWRTLQSLVKTAVAEKLEITGVLGSIELSWSYSDSEAVREALAHSVLDSKLSWMEMMSSGDMCSFLVYQGIVRVAIDASFRSKFSSRVALDQLGLYYKLTAEQHPSAQEINEWGITEELYEILRFFFDRGMFNPTTTTQDNDLMDAPFLFEDITAICFILKWWAFEQLHGSPDDSLLQVFTNSDINEAGTNIEQKVLEDLNVASQVSDAVSYVEALNYIIREEGIQSMDLVGLFRGLAKPPSANALQGIKDQANRYGAECLGPNWKSDTFQDARKRFVHFAKPTREELLGRRSIIRGAEVIGNSQFRIVMVKQPFFSSELDAPRILRLSGDFSRFNEVGHKSFIDVVTGENVEIDGGLPMGSVVLSGINSSNPAMESISILQKEDGNYVMLCIENKRTNSINKSAVEQKLKELKKYRGILFVEDDNTPDNTPDNVPDGAKELGLPLVKEKDVIYVLVTAKGCNLEKLDEVDVGDLKTQVVHVGAESFFGPTLCNLPVPANIDIPSTGEA